jgi:hypothetical protein
MIIYIYVHHESIHSTSVVDFESITNNFHGLVNFLIVLIATLVRRMMIFSSFFIFLLFLLFEGSRFHCDGIEIISRILCNVITTTDGEKKMIYKNDEKITE